MTPFKPLTREEVAQILSISLSTLDGMIAAGTVPPPQTLGGRRHYWHPDTLYAWLDRRLRGEGPDESSTTEQAPSPPKKRERHTRAATPAGLAEHARSRDAARVCNLNASV